MISSISSNAYLAYSPKAAQRESSNAPSPTPKDNAQWSTEGYQKWQDSLQSLGIDPKKLEEMQRSTQAMLLEQFQKDSQDSGLDLQTIDPILYNVKDDEVAAPTNEYWNSENTSQRIVDFAMSFQEASGEDYSSYLEKAREAVQKGFKEAKEILGDISGPSAKLFNDTYESAMKKFDELAKAHQENNQGAPAGAPLNPISSSQPSLNLVA